MSALHLHTPVVEQGQAEEAEQGSFGSALPTNYLPQLKNYANDEKTKHFFQSEVAEVMDQTRKDRLTLEEEWESIREMVMMKHGAGRRYFGRSDSYLPVYKRERKKIVSALSSGLFPSDEYFDVTDLATGDPEVARPVKNYMQWEMDTNAQLRAQIKKFLGQVVDYGTSPMKIWYKKELRTEGGVKRQIKMPGFAMNEYGFKKYTCEGMAVSPRNLMYWYVYPMTADSLDDALMVFEDIDVPHSFVIAMKAAKRWENADYVLGYNEIPEHERAQAELMELRGGGAYRHGRDGPDWGRMYTISEVWCHMVLPRDAYMPDEDPELPIPVRVVCAGDMPMEITRNPFFHQRPPYVVARMDAEPGAFYGNAEGRLIKPLQFLSNDFMNQTNDNGIYALNPISLINVGMMVGPPRPLSPGAPWYVNGPPDQAVKFITPPMQQVPLGVQMTQMAIGMAQDAGGAPPDRAYQGKGSKTATGMQIMQKNALMPLQDVVEDIEVECMIMILRMGWRNGVQYRDGEIMASVAGERVVINAEQLAIEADFRWWASSQAANANVRNQLAMEIIRLTLPMVQLLNMQGYIVDFVPLLAKIHAGFGFRGFSQFIRKAQAAPGAQPGMPIGPGQQMGVHAEQQDRMRSAMEQTPGGTETEAQPGEGEEFMDVRSEADDLAGMLGGVQ